MVIFPQTMAQRYYAYQAWKAALILKGGIPQWDNSQGQITQIWFYDGPEVNICQLWQIPVPQDIIDGGYTQEQNDADTADFEAVYQANGNAAIQPKTSDGRQSNLPNLFPDTMQLCFAGAADDPEYGIGGGMLFQHHSDDDGYGPTLHTVTFGFNDWIYLSGGHMTYNGAVLGDTVSYSVYAPATAVTGSDGYGNVNLVSGVVIVPGANTNYEVNMATAVPVPSPTNTGYWNWTPAANNLSVGTITPNLTGTGAYNLYAMRITLADFIIQYPLLGSNYMDLSVPAILPKKVLPQWVHQVQVNNSGHNGLQLVWALTLSRQITVGM
jgi:hypothetical protein